jgi:hypothetical protein
MDIIQAKLQTKNWRQNCSWYTTGKKHECEIYQRSLIEKITKNTCSKTNIRINIITKELCSIKNPFKEDNGLELTEDFDGIIKNLPNMNEYYFNLKMVCDSGGAQTRTMREVYHFIYNMLEYLLKYNIKNQYFINILDGDCSYKYMRKFNYTQNYFKILTFFL